VLGRPSLTPLLARLQAVQNDAEELPRLALAFPLLRRLDCVLSGPASVHNLSLFTMLRELKVQLVGEYLGAEGQMAMEHMVRLTKLECLGMHNFRRTDLEGLGALAQLRELQLEFCFSSDAALVEVGKLTTLTCLSISHCQLISSTGLAPLSNLTALQELRLGIFQTAMAFEALASLRSLRSLSFIRTLYQAEELKHLSSLSALQHISFFHNQDLVSSHLDKMQHLFLARPSLQALSLTFLSDPAQLTPLAVFVGLTSLELHVSLPATATGEELHQLAPLTGLRCIRIHDHNIVHWDFITNFTVLTQLSIERHRYGRVATVSQRAATFISRLPRLELLRLDQPLVDITPFSRLSALTRLCVSGVRDKGLAALGSMRRLRHLALSDASFVNVDFFNRCLSSLVCLTSLQMFIITGVTQQQVHQLLPSLPLLVNCSINFTCIR
jgi:hypothetical protein